MPDPAPPVPPKPSLIEELRQRSAELREASARLQRVADALNFLAGKKAQPSDTAPPPGE